MSPEEWVQLRDLLEKAMIQVMELKGNPRIVEDLNRAYAFANCVTKNQED